KGRVINCKNAIFIMTSNLGSQQLLNYIEKEENPQREDLLNLLDPILKGHFRPEFLNRLDEVLPFLPLKKQEIQKIVVLQLEILKKRMQDKQLKLSWDEDVTLWLAEHGFDSLFGARPLKRLIQQEIVNKLSVGILGGDIISESNVHLKVQNGSPVYEVNQREMVSL
ncbi:MAG: ATP-dependent Clp protease ATP-binding subunit, partial [Flavobacteriales bacterium]|nr:ATP-dependent Clp protease ATP-binding subunit [Flavobacteriales bacterium]